MATPFMGEIRLTAFENAPQGWALCEGQLLSIAEHSALFSVIGTSYGGNGYTTFALPNLKGRAPVQAGQGPGLSLHVLGQTGGAAGIVLDQAEMPSHSHPVNTTLNPPTSDSPEGQMMSAAKVFHSPESLTAMAPPDATGGNEAHENVQPFLGLNYMIALEGIYPPRP